MDIIIGQIFSHGIQTDLVILKHCVLEFCDSSQAIKNEVELAGMKEAHIRDAMAECTFLAWLEDLALNNEEELKKLNEFTVAEKLNDLRKSMVSMSLSECSQSICI